MELLILLLIAGVMGYLLSGSRYSQKIDETTSKVTDESEGALRRMGRWTRNIFGRGKRANNFLSWSTTNGAAHFPQEFNSWLKELTPEEADQFTNSLMRYLQGLGYKVEDYTSGKMEHKPAQMQIFVEAVVIYSNEYRRAHEAQVEAKKAEESKKPETSDNGSSSADGKAVAEKQPSRRKGATGEVVQPSVAA